MYDNTCKFLAETFPSDFASWLLGESVSLTQLSPSELSLEPIRADALILLTSDEIVLHIEFQVEPDPTMPFRMADYRLRIFRRFPHKRMIQVVIYLTPSNSALVYQNVFEIPGTRHEFTVIRLWEQPTPLFLESSGLLPLAVLTQTPDKAQTLRQVASLIEDIEDSRVKSNVAASTGILAGLSLDKRIIHQVLRREVMQQSVIYQEWREEFLQEGRQEGLLEGERSLVLRLLHRKIGSISPELEQQIQMLSVAQLDALGEALLDFSSSEDLVQWLQSH
jgi:predicted transposase/invertase (TIGR01784 family)